MNSYSGSHLRINPLYSLKRLNDILYIISCSNDDKKMLKVHQIAIIFNSPANYLESWPGKENVKYFPK